MKLHNTCLINDLFEKVSSIVATGSKFGMIKAQKWAFILFYCVYSVCVKLNENFFILSEAHVYYLCCNKN